ncbi:uncharacterized protein J4E92_001686 [Alternaria infectoria]|uniref:uncharacterized protein n=1 Tax=Alternaria infectoria TaxID=45303 RepID=UPI00221F944C|nr:uncharacterized protein J4E92_001686 [Alternaria infectoria]KAI4936961.1 hypothetical protein J4E92_001686 [Alternaria infectoria]
MESVVAVRANEGSPAAQSALAVLAATLNINENALKTALNGAFDLLPAAAGNTMLALQMSFQRLSYHIDSKALVEIIMTFRRAFGGALSMERVKSMGRIQIKTYISVLRGTLPQVFDHPASLLANTTTSR